MTTIQETLDAIRKRTAQDRAEYSGTAVDRSVLDREYLLEQLDNRV